MGNGREIYEYLESFFSDSRKVMWLTLTIGVVCSIISIVFTTGIYRDAVLYCSMTNAFNIGDWERAFYPWLPPLLPLLSGLLCKVGFTVYYATMIVGCAFCVLTIFPLYGILCFFMDKKYAAWGALFYMLAPKIMRFGLTSLLESGKFFFFTLSVYLVFCFAKDKKIIKLVYLGIAFAFLTLIRAEGIIYVPVILLALVLLCLRDEKYKVSFKFLRNMFIYCALSVFIMLIVVSPRMYQVYKETGYMAIDTRQGEGIKAVITKLSGADKTASAMVSPYPAGLSNFDFSWLTDSKFIKKFVGNFPRGSYEIYLILAVLGVIVLCKRKEWKLEYSICIWFMVANALMFYMMRSAVYRYFLLNVIILMPFTVMGYKIILDKITQFKLQKFFLLAIVAVAVYQIINGMQNSINTREFYYVQLGRWIKKHKPELKNPAGSQLTILAYGKDYGWGVFAETNIINYRNNVTNYKLKEIIEKGVPAKLCSYAMEKMDNEEILIPDMIIFSSPAKYKNEIETVKSLAKVKELHTNWSDKAVTFIITH